MKGNIAKIENYGSQKCLLITINGEEKVMASVPNDSDDFKRYEDVYINFKEKYAFFDIATENNIEMNNKNLNKYLIGGKEIESKFEKWVAIRNNDVYAFACSTGRKTSTENRTREKPVQIEYWHVASETLVEEL